MFCLKSSTKFVFIFLILLIFSLPIHAYQDNTLSIKGRLLLSQIERNEDKRIPQRINFETECEVKNDKDCTKCSSEAQKKAEKLAKEYAIDAFIKLLECGDVINDLNLQDDLPSYLAANIVERADFSATDCDRVKADGYYNCKIRFEIIVKVSEKLKNRLKEIVERGELPYPTDTTTITTATTATTTPITTATTATTTTTVTHTTSIPYEDLSIKHIRKRGKLLVGVYEDVPPFVFIEENQYIGFDIDLMRAIADKWGVKAEFMTVKPEERVSVICNKQVDIVAAAMTHTKEIDEKIDFSQTYFSDAQSLLVRVNSSINGLTDLNATNRIGVLKESTLADINAIIVPFDNCSEAVEALINGKLDAFTNARGILSYFVSKYPKKLKVIRETFSRYPYGLCLPPNDSNFRDGVNFTLQQLKIEGKYDQIYRKWFGEDIPCEIEIFPGGFPFVHIPDSFSPLSESKVDKILREGTFRAGIRRNFKPFSYVKKDKRVGFDVDIINEFAIRWLGKKDAVIFELMTADERIPALLNDKVDIVAAAMTHNNKRDIDIDFSQTYFLDGQRLLVRSDSNIEGFHSLMVKNWQLFLEQRRLRMLKGNLSDVE